MKRILSYIAPYKWAAIIAFLFMLVELAVELIQPLIIGKIIDDGVMKGDLHIIMVWGFVMVGLGVLAFLGGISNGFFSSHAAQSFAYDLRTDLFKKVQSLSMTKFLNIPTSSMITRMTNDVTQVQNVFYMSMRFMLRAPLVVIGSLIMAFFVNAYLAMYLIIALPFLLLFLWFITKKGAKNFSAVQRRVDQVNRTIQENLQASRLIKAYMRGLYEASRFQKLAKLLKEDTVKALRLMERVQPILLVVMNLALLVVLWFGAKEVAANRIPVGDLVAIFNYTMRITGNFSMFAFIITFFSRAMASGERMNEVLALEDEQNKVLKSGNKKDAHYLDVNNVDFSYSKDSKKIIKDIHFHCEKEETIAIMGATGSGKSTLLQLFPKLYEPTLGTISFNGKDLEQWNVAELRQKIGYVPQRSLLFTGSIFDNITWGKEHASQQEVEEACRVAQIHESIMRFPDGYQTRVGQKGVNLSGGQKQRIAIARALIRQPELLIFDDSMSALDITTEGKLWLELQKTHATMLVVTQKISTAKSATKILLMDEGQIIAQGTHTQLVQNSALYREIVASQQEVGSNA
ncbi:MAG: ABC transporter ATP-binding protein [Kurthia sp.]|nr:ABC transporter ATP-binding protein [Candidatus Kurthia equi]